MKPQSIRRLRAAAIALGGVAIAVSIIPAVHADTWDKKTTITIDQPMQVTDTYLEPGSYVFKLLGQDGSNRHVVQIFNKDQSHLINTVMAMPNWRLRPTGGSRFLMYETPAGSVNALHAWFYPGDNFGQEFTYPKHLRQVAVNTPPPPPPSFAPAPPAAVEPAPVEVPQTQAEVAPAPEPAPAEVAQNNPPPMPESTPTPAPAELPKTASPYPLIGLAGGLLLGLGALLRTKQTA